MADYCTIDDIRKMLDEQILIQLTDDERTGSVVESRVEGAIKDATDEINGLIGKRIPLPLNPVPDLALAICVDIAIYRLFLRRQSVPQERKDIYDSRIKFLMLVGKGEASLGEKDPEGSGGSQAPEITSEERNFTRTKTTDF